MRAGSRVPERASRRDDRPMVIAAVAIGLLFLFPIGYLVWGTITFGGDTWEALTSSRTLRPLANSLLIATVVTGLCGVLGVSTAWLVSRTDLPGRRLLRLALPLPLVIPSFVGATAYLAGFGRGGLIEAIPRLDGFWGATLVLTLLSYPYVYLPVLARLMTTSDNLEEAARLLDGRFGRMWVRVVVPQIRGAAAAGMLLTFLYVLSDFGAVTLMRFDTITRAIFSARLFDRAASLTLGLILAIVALLVAAAARRVGVPDAPSATNPAIRRRYPLGWGRLPAAALVGLLVAVAFAAPIAVFLSWVTRGSTTVGVGFSGFGDDLGFLAGPIVNTTVASVVAAVVATVVVLPVAYAAARRRTGLAAWSGAAVASVFALPGLVVALAIVFWALQAPSALAGLYQTFPLLVLAYVLHFGAQSMTATRAAIADLPRRYDEAARTLGADRRRRFRTVELPLILPGVLSGTGLVMLSTMKELPATLLLAPIGFQTLATQIWGAAEDGFFAEVGITSLVLIALSWLMTWWLVLRNQPAAPGLRRRSGSGAREFR